VLVAALGADPGLGEAYWYLGELLLRTGRLPLAWYAAQTAARLGVPAEMLVNRLSRLGKNPEQYPWQRKPRGIALRKVTVESAAVGQALLERLVAGEVLFEYLGGVDGVIDPVKNGGYAGVFSPDELQAEVAAALVDLPPYAPPVMVTVGEEILLVQRILPFDLDGWRRLAAEASAAAVSEDAGLVRTVVDPDKYRVYAGAFKKRDQAMGVVGRLRQLSFPAFCLQQEKDGGFFFYVVAGQFDDRSTAVAAVDRLSGYGYDTFVSKRR